MKMQQEFPPLQNNHHHSSSSSDYSEQITRFAFQLTRKTPLTLIHLSNELSYLLISLKNALFISDDTDEIHIIIHYLILLYKLILYTRDIFVGKGERDLTYMMIYVWYTQFPILAIKMLTTITGSITTTTTTTTTTTCENKFGSWKDIKYFCNYIKNNSIKTTEDPFIETCIYLLNQQLIKDLSENKIQNKLSLVSKWIPREKSKKFGWLFDKCALQWSQIMYPEYYYFPTIKPTIKFQNKIKREYRKNISHLNRCIDTVQIKQCENKWSEINFNYVSEITKQQQMNTFLNQDIYGYIRTQTEDRNICRDNLISYLFFRKPSQETK